MSLFLFFYYFLFRTTGSCIEYGHSCWGAHGKRSGGKASATLFPSNENNDINLADAGLLPTTLPTEERAKLGKYILLNFLIDRVSVFYDSRGLLVKFIRCPFPFCEGENN